MYKFGIIGAGSIAARFCNAVSLIEDATINSVASKSEEKAKSFASKNNIPQYYGSYEKMLDEASPDIVYIATTHNFHYENIMLCLEKGKHVLCEKPFVLTAKEAVTVFDYAKERRLFVMEAMWSRFLPHIRQVKKWIENGLIGTVEYITSSIGWKAEYNPESRIFAKNLAGGALYDIGVYPIEILTYLIKEELLEINSAVNLAPTGVDRTSQVTMKFTNCIATFTASVSAHTPEETIICGSEGYIKMSKMNVSDEAWLFRRGCPEEHFKQKYEEGFVFETEEVLRCVRLGLTESPEMPHKDTITAAEIYEKVLKK